jgi:hypothetical protein
LIGSPQTSPSPTVLTLFDGATLTLSPHELTAGADTPATSSPSGQLYFVGGRVDTPHGFLGGYLGQSSDVDGPRAARSIRRWTITQRRIHPTGIALLTRDQEYPGDHLRLIEARTIQDLSSSGLWLLNTHTNAGLASARLSHRQVLDGQQLAAEIAQAIRTHLFNGQVNPYPSPASNTREAAVRVVLHAPRAVDTFDVMRSLRHAGVTTTGRSWDFTLRRDLTVREHETRGRRRILSTLHQGRRLYWNPATLTRRTAIDLYGEAHPF